MVIRALDRKLFRDVWRLRGQVLAVALVIGSGVALLVMSLSTHTSLVATRDAFYDRYAFAEVFGSVKRAPERLVERIGDIDGVQAVDARIAAFASIDMPGVAEPVVARLISVPHDPASGLNRIALSAGRLPERGSSDEAVIYKPFAEAHALNLGGTFKIVMNGRQRQVRVVGIGLSPEVVYAIAPGALMPDKARYAIVWMNKRGLAAAYDLKGAFNDLALTLLRGVDAERVIERLDPLLERYGGAGAYARADQVSNWFLQDQLDQTKTMATVLPGIFLAVAAFLTNTVLARLIATERREISLMKAFGYSNWQIGWHYAGLATIMAAAGVLLGWAVGDSLGRYNTEINGAYYQFPFLYYRPNGMEYLLSAVVSLASALFGAFWAVRSAVSLTPAEAMRPPAPDNFRKGALPASLTRALDNQTRMIMRQIPRAPIRAALTAGGTALAIAVLVMAIQWDETIDGLLQSHFADTQRQDVTVSFFEPLPPRALNDIKRLPGVLSAEPMRDAPAELSHSRAAHRGSLTGLSRTGRLQAIHDVNGWTWPVPPGGVILGSVLAEKLGVEVGDEISAQALLGARPTLDLMVVGVFETLIGTPAYMNLDVLTRALGEPGQFDRANLLVSSAEAPDLYAALKQSPAVASVTVKQAAIDTFRETVAETLLVFTLFFVMFSSALAAGVAYNAARIALSERGRELATLRVLGFTKGETAYILLGENALLTFVALPLGCLAGAALAWVMNHAFQTELYRIPFLLSPGTYALAVGIVCLAVVGAAWLARRRLDTLDLIAVLKTRE